jgi:aspartyl protease family protein
MDANGDISVGSLIILREVQIGNKVLHDVQATVMANQNAPLLMGQSALEKFGRISIDYEKGEISFE